MKYFFLLAGPLLFDEKIRKNGAPAVFPNIIAGPKPSSKHKIYLENGLSGIKRTACAHTIGVLLRMIGLEAPLNKAS